MIISSYDDHHNTKWSSYHPMMIVIIPYDNHIILWWSSYYRSPLCHLKILKILHMLCISCICFNCQNVYQTFYICAVIQLIIICTKFQNPLNILCAINIVSSQICCKNSSTLFAQQLYSRAVIIVVISVLWAFLANNLKIQTLSCSCHTAEIVKSGLSTSAFNASCFFIRIFLLNHNNVCC